MWFVQQSSVQDKPMCYLPSRTFPCRDFNANFNASRNPAVGSPGCRPVEFSWTAAFSEELMDIHFSGRGLRQDDIGQFLKLHFTEKCLNICAHRSFLCWPVHIGWWYMSPHSDGRPSCKNRSPESRIAAPVLICKRDIYGPNNIPEGSLSALLGLRRACGKIELHFLHQGLIFKHIRKYFGSQNDWIKWYQKRI